MRHYYFHVYLHGSGYWATREWRPWFNWLPWFGRWLNHLNLLEDKFEACRQAVSRLPPDTRVHLTLTEHTVERIDHETGKVTIERISEPL
jgi:hypothetical protein